MANSKPLNSGDKQKQHRGLRGLFHSKRPKDSASSKKAGGVGASEGGGAAAAGVREDERRAKKKEADKTGGGLDQNGADTASAAKEAVAIAPPKLFSHGPMTLWQRAYQNVADEDSDLIQKYEDMVRAKVIEIEKDDNKETVENASGSINVLGKEEQTAVIVEHCQRTIKSRQWKLRLGSKQIKVREQVQRIAKCVQQFSGAIGAVAALDPVYAGPAWTAISLALPFLVNSLGQDDKLRDGLERISRLVVIYRAIQKQLIGPDAVKNVEFEKSMLRLYSKMLMFQIKAACHLCHKTPTRLISDAMVSNDWTAMIAEVDKRDIECKAFQDVMSTGLLLGRIQDLTEKFETWTSLQNENIKILRWISEDNPAIDHSNVRTKLGNQYFDTGKWLLDPDEGHDNYYRQWKKTPNGCLWLKGSVGTGKSCLTSIVIQDIADNEDNDVLAFYYASKSQQTLSGTASLAVLRSLLSQLACSSDGIDMCEAVKGRYEAAIAYGSRSPELTLEDCADLIPMVLLDQDASFIVVDALDECEKPGELVRHLRDILAKSPNLRLFVSSRMEVRVKDTLQSTVEVGSDAIETSPDISNYISKELNRAERRNSDVISTAMAETMINTLRDLSQGMFRWVELQLELLISEEHPILVPQEFDDRLVDLKKHSGSLDQLSRAYEDVWEQNLRNQGMHAQRIATKALRWISCCVHPFGPMMLHNAVMIDEVSSLARSTTPAVILRLCSNFLVEERGGAVRFAHVSVREFLEEKRMDGLFQFSLAESNAQVVHTCLNFWASYSISLQELERMRTEDDGVARFLDQQKHSFAKYCCGFENKSGFLDCSFQEADAKHAIPWQRGHKIFLSPYNMWLFGCYASIFWVHHSIAAEVIRKDKTTALYNSFRTFFGLSGGFGLYRSWLANMKSPFWPSGYDVNPVRAHNEDDRLEPSQYLTMCRYGFDEVLPDVMRKDWLKVVSRDSRMTGLHLAAAHGHPKIIQFLLRFGADANSRDEFYSTPLHFAAEQENLEAVRVLCEFVAPEVVESHKNYQTTPTSLTKSILKRPIVDINARDWRHHTPLNRAAELNHIEIVDYLLHTKDIDPNAFDDADGTVLHVAAKDGNVAIVDLLLGIDGVDINCRDESGRTPLHIAVRYEQTNMLDHLLRRCKSIDINATDKDGRTPLLIAANEGRSDIVGCLMQIPDIDLLVSDVDRKALLDYAAIRDYDSVIQRLLRFERTDATTLFIRGRNRLHLAACRGNAKLIIRLLETGLFEVNVADSDGRTALHLIAMYERRIIEVLDALVSTPSARIVLNPNILCGFGRTILHWAIAKGNLDLVRQLLLHFPPLPDSGSNSTISFESRTAIVPIWMPIDINARDSQANTPLHEAVKPRHEFSGDLLAIVELLLEVEGVDVQAKNGSGKTPFELAVAALDNARRVADGDDDDDDDNDSDDDKYSWDLGENRCEFQTRLSIFHLLRKAASQARQSSLRDEQTRISIRKAPLRRKSYERRRSPPFLFLSSAQDSSEQVPTFSNDNE